MAAPKSVNFNDVINDITQGKLAPTYLLHGNEAYFIDELVKKFETIIPEDERDFNLYSLYAPQTPMDAVVSTCLRLPVMAPLQVVILKEAQAKKAELTKLIPYISTVRPNNRTIFVIVCRGEKYDNKSILNALGQGGGKVFESKAVKDWALDKAIEGLVKLHGLNIEPKGLLILKSHLGSDLSKLANEIQKLAMILGKGSMVTPEAIEQNIGISKDYNNFELIDAIAAKDLKKTLTIVEYFSLSPKRNPAIPTAAVIFNFFANLLAVQFSPDKSNAAISKITGARWDVQLRPYLYALKTYNAWITIEIISALREFDVKAKGIGSRQDEYTLFKDLIYKIFFATGRISV